MASAAKSTASPRMSAATAKSLTDATWIEFDATLYEGVNIKIRTFPDGSMVYGNSKIVSPADNKGNRYLFPPSACAVIALWDSAPLSELSAKNTREANVSKQNKLETHLGLRSPFAIIQFAYELGAWTHELDFENVGRTLPQEPEGLLEVEHIRTLAEILEVGVQVNLLDAKGKLVQNTKVCDGHFTITLILKNLHYQNKGDQEGF